MENPSFEDVEQNCGGWRSCSNANYLLGWAVRSHDPDSVEIRMGSPTELQSDFPNMDEIRGWNPVNSHKWPLNDHEIAIGIHHLY